MRTQLFELPVDILTREQTVARILSAIERKQRCQHVALNVAKLVNARSDKALAEDLRAADIVGIDGMGIVYALRILGHTNIERVAGIDLFEEMIAQCARRGLRPYFLGARADVLARTIETLGKRHPGLRIAGSHHGYFPESDEDEICGHIRDSGADCLFIAMPTPRKEHFMRRHRDSLGVPFLMGVGGSFDVVAEKVARAPRLFQDSGLEWLYRLLQEPRRMAGRYLRTNTIFAMLMLGTVARLLFGARAS
jgi:N-acetylglucosaminyldiphosphoundecaprenol N-acetyl-beta-D-mannosaminyltransferase